MSGAADERTPGWVGERAVIDVLPRAVVVTDAIGNILLWNLQAEHLYGWAEHEVVGRPIVQVLAPAADAVANLVDLASVAGGRSMSGDRTVVRRDGSLVRVATFTRPVLDGEGTVLAIVGASEDVTDLRAAERRARELDDQLDLALEAGGLGTWRWDLASGDTSWDERLETLFGLPPDGFDGSFEMYVSLLHPDDRENVLGTVRAAVESRSSYRVEHRIVWPDGSIHWIVGSGGVTVDDHGAVTGTVGCAMDVTDRANREQERRQLTAVAVEAAERERLQRERLEFLATINDALNASSSVHEIMANVTSRAVPRLGDWCSIHVLPENAGGVPEIEVAHVDPAMVAYARELQKRFPYDPDAPSGIAHVIRTGDIQFYPEITDELIGALNPTAEEREIIAQLALQSAIAVPLVKGDRILGAIQFVISSSSRRYTEDDVSLARIVAGRLAASLENRRLSEKQRVIAQTLQRSLLPAAMPDIVGLELAVRYWPVGQAIEVGGDFYDAFPLEAEHQWGLVIGDVCGTGPAAAALTGLARHSIRDSAWHGDCPVDVLHSLNRAVRRSGTDSFLTAIFAVLDTSGVRPVLRLACGGHPLPIHAGRHTTKTIGKPGTLLGVFDRGRFHIDTVELDPGDVIVFYTDGATDIPPPGGLTDTEFAALVREAVDLRTTAEATADCVRESLDAIRPFSHRDDDVALLVLHVATAK